MPSKLPTEPGLDFAKAVGSIPFQSPEFARGSLARIALSLPPELRAALPSLLSESPNPDACVLLLDRMLSESSPETVRLFDRHHRLLHYAVVIFGHSQFLGETLIQNPDLLQSFLREKTLDQAYSREEFRENCARFRSRTTETDVSLLLARFKRREYVRILLRDALRLATLAETTAEISALSDVLVEVALRDSESELQARYGPPQHCDPDGRRVMTSFAVLSLGKLGGNELNYSSDIDLLYLFEDGPEASGARLTNHEYFVRLAQQLTGTLSQVTREGPVFRIDLRLRPEGGQGAIAIGLKQALHYYANTAQDWELQALIKLRHSAGNEDLARRFIQEVQPYVYTPEVNFAAVKTALISREKMHKGKPPSVGRETGGVDVKIDPGGIRDIEFLVQCLQRVYGGAEPWLRSRGTLFSLQKLHDKKHLVSQEFHELTITYEFLRRIEHSLQLRQGRQTHQLPSSGEDLQIVRRSMAPYCLTEPAGEDFLSLVQRRMAAVSQIYGRMVYQQHSGEAPAADAAFQLRSLPEPGLGDRSNRQILQRIGTDAPVLYEIATRTTLTPVARKNLFRFLTSALTSSEKYATVLRHCDLVARSLVLFEASEYLTDILVRHPEEIATLAELSDVRSRAGSGYLFESDLGQGRAADPVFDYLSHSVASYAEKLALLRRHFRHRVFTTGAKDIAELRDVYRSLGEITAATEDAIAAAFEISGAPDGLAVMALGRLGSGEFDVFSDADLLFVCEENSDREALSQAAWKIVQALNAYTQEGTLFPVDVRLRPRGAEGELLVSPSQMSSYFTHEAQAWEALTYSKLRFLAGSSGVAGAAIAAGGRLFRRFSAEDDFQRDVLDMRSKLESTASAEKSFKTSPGGIYDVDFLCAFLLVKNGITDKSGSLHDRIWRCSENGLLKKTDAARLGHATELLRTTDHVARLALGRTSKWLPATTHARQVCERLTSQVLQREFREGLEVELDQACRDVREIYRRTMSASSG